MKQIPNIEETNTREVEEVIKEFYKIFDTDNLWQGEDEWTKNVPIGNLEQWLRTILTEKDAEVEKARTTLHTSLVTAVEGLEEYMEAKDNSSHRYEIPRSKKKEWEAFCEIPEDDERSWDVPEWANRIDGMPVRSIKEQVLTIINSIFKE